MHDDFLKINFNRDDVRIALALVVRFSFHPEHTESLLHSSVHFISVLKNPESALHLSFQPQPCPCSETEPACPGVPRPPGCVECCVHSTRCGPTGRRRTDSRGATTRRTGRWRSAGALAKNCCRTSKTRYETPSVHHHPSIHPSHCVCYPSI